MFAFIPVAAVAALAPLTSAFTIHTPGSWLGNSSVTLTWDYAQLDPNFSIELGNTHIRSGLLSQGAIAVGNNIVPNTQSYSFELPTLPADGDYFVYFVQVDNVNNVYANSSLFPILDNPHSTTAQSSTISTNGGSTGKSSTHSATTTGKNSTTATSTGSSTNTVSNTNTISTPTSASSFTSLVISTTASQTSTTSTGAATRVEAAWYVGFVTALLGAVLA